jgi:hypothetical protein
VIGMLDEFATQEAARERQTSRKKQLENVHLELQTAGLWFAAFEISMIAL